MSTEQKPEVSGTCFVVMGFGKKTDFETGRTLDLDKTYRNIIKPAVEAAGLECIRADEIPHSGIIDVPMYEQLLGADVVVADLSTSNKNAFYELGVRHALRPETTIVICEDGIKAPPFDVNHVLIRMYHHMGEGIDFDEVERFRKVLSDAITAVYNKDPRDTDSPVYTFLKGLPDFREAIKGVAKGAAESSPAAVTGDAHDNELYSALMEQADEAQKDGDFVTAKALLSRLRKKMKEAARKEAEEAAKNGIKDFKERPEDPYLIQRLALATYKSKQPNPQAALEEARDLLATLGPETSNDTETLGMWGSVHKRLWEMAGDRAHLDKAVRGYERGFYLRNDYYNGINFAYLLNVRAAKRAKRSEAVADFVQAERVRREVLDICEAEMKDGGPPGYEQKYWVLATWAEALLGSGDEEGARAKFEEACAVLPEPQKDGWMRESTEEQMGKLRALLSDSPLKYVREDGD
ncbi:MAG TPA: tetratricopeptide repeat-containing protein [Pyrinomonadaceae bacterium]|nr:tetratricopeptide repeat-containing protein [Pyrinomonadaceae bacterium]